MSRSRRPFLLFALLLSIALRTAVGAPCCLTLAQAAEVADHSDHSDAHEAADKGGDHGGHGDDPTAKPCCSACGPTLPPETATFTVRIALRELPIPDAVLSLATRPPFQAYDATGPPLLI